MPEPKYARLERLERRRKVAQLYLQRMTQTEIAQRLGVKQPVVSRDLRRIEREWSESASGDFAAARNAELRKLDLLERELWEAWERSKKEGRRTAQFTKNDGKETTRSGIVQHPGDPKYLDLIHKNTALRRALLVAGPNKAFGRDGTPEVEVPLSVRRDRVLAVARALRDRHRLAEGLSDPNNNSPGAPDQHPGEGRPPGV